MAHRGSFRGRSGISQSQRRKKSWVQVTGPTIGTDGSVNLDKQTPSINLVVPTTSQGAVDVAVASAGVFSDPVADKIPAESTILRLRGSVNLPKNSFTVTTVENYAIGIGVMESGAAALGAFPNPATPEGGAWDGWMWFRSQQAGSLDANASVVDVKSMRKIQSGQSMIVVVGEYLTRTDGAVATTLAFSVQINLRALILLP